MGHSKGEVLPDNTLLLCSGVIVLGGGGVIPQGGDFQGGG